MQYKENKKITGGDYDKSLAVKCVNGTFVGKKADGLSDHGRAHETHHRAAGRRLSESRYR